MRYRWRKAVKPPDDHSVVVSGVRVGYETAEFRSLFLRPEIPMSIYSPTRDVACLKLRNGPHVQVDVALV